MFTGIIEAIGQIAETQPMAGGLRLRIQAGRLELSDLRVGDSVAINGVCLTVAEKTADGFWADVSHETSACTTFASVRPGTKLNLEKALTLGGLIGGHLVSGHVDGVGTVTESVPTGDARRLRISAPAELGKFIARKGSISVDGVSLTVNAVDRAEFEVTLIPHTLASTTLGECAAGVKVNLEVDVIARHVERLLRGDS